MLIHVGKVGCAVTLFKYSSDCTSYCIFEVERGIAHDLRPIIPTHFLPGQAHRLSGFSFELERNVCKFGRVANAPRIQ